MNKELKKTLKETLKDAIAAYPWESDTQKEAYLTYIKYLKDNNLNQEPWIASGMAWMIQKDHESNLYWTESIGNQIQMLQDQIVDARNFYDFQIRRLGDMINGDLSVMIRKQIKEEGKKRGRHRSNSSGSKLRSGRSKRLNATSKRAKLPKKGRKLRKSSS